MPDVYAEDLNYWKTSARAADTWIDMARKEIDRAGGAFQGEVFATDVTGRAAFMLSFALAGDVFRVTWPVLESKTGNWKAAKVQAATLLYHDVKARCLAARVLGARASFMAFLVLPDGRTAGQVASVELAHALPKLLVSE